MQISFLPMMTMKMKAGGQSVMGEEVSQVIIAGLMLQQLQVEDVLGGSIEALAHFHQTWSN